MPKGSTFDSAHGPGVGMSSSGSSGSGSSHISSSGSTSRIRSAINSAVASVSNAAHANTSLIGDRIREVLMNPSTSARGAMDYDSYINDYGIGFDMDDYYDRLMEMAQYNNEWSASQAEKQMQYQTKSDQAAMAWSALEAKKSRDWSENLSNTAHQREIKDLLAAGLNPILSANSGAWSGSGVTGQGFTSSGAMGQTDMSVPGVFGNMVSGMMTTARDLAMTKITTDAQKYATDKQFAAAKMAAETSIYNNNSNIDANKAIRALDRDADIRKAGISADATRAAAAANAGAITSAAATNASAARYSADQHLLAAQESAAASRYSANRSYDTSKYVADKNQEIQNTKNQSSMLTNPAGYLDYMQGTRFGQALDEVAQAIFGGNVYQPHEIGDWNNR